MNSWIAELIAVYSPPIPAPVRKRNSAKLQKSHEAAVEAVAAREPERHKEELLAAKPVGQVAEQHGTGDRASEVGAADEPNLRRAEMQDRAFLQRSGNRAGQGHLEAVEDPGDTERGDDEGMKAGPRQAVEPRGDIGLDDCKALRHAEVTLWRDDVRSLKR